METLQVAQLVKRLVITDASEIVMSKAKHILSFCCFFVLLCAVAPTNTAIGQKSNCQGSDRSKIKYKLALVSKTLEDEPTLILQISVKPKHFNKTDLLLLAKRLKEEYCKVTKLNVALFDSYKEAKGVALIHAWVTKSGKTGALRGFYDLNRITHKESIMFATKRNSQLDEVVIDLSKTPEN